LPDLERRLDTIHELHTIINKRFNAEGIEIAFPQRDLHLRSLPPGFPLGSTMENVASNGQHGSASKTEAS
jgi:small-conductance mechanosensitive channel